MPHDFVSKMKGGTDLSLLFMEDPTTLNNPKFIHGQVLKLRITLNEVPDVFLSKLPVFSFLRFGLSALLPQQTGAVGPT